MHNAITYWQNIGESAEAGISYCDQDGLLAEHAVPGVEKDKIKGKIKKKEKMLGQFFQSMKLLRVRRKDVIKTDFFWNIDQLCRSCYMLFSMVNL